MTVAGSPVVGSPLPAVTMSSLVPVLTSLVAALTSLVQVLQSQIVSAGVPLSAGQATAGAATLASADGGVSGGGGMDGCCGGAMGAAAGPDALGTVQEPDQQSTEPVQVPAQPATFVSGPTRHSKQENALVVADVARKLGVDPVLAVATMLVESNGNNTNNSGDKGTSFGLFQLHIGGELPKEWYPGTPGHDNAFDPRKNAETALSRFAAKRSKYSGAELAYQSQRPAHHDAYVNAVNSRMAEARSLLGM